MVAHFLCESPSERRFYLFKTFIIGSQSCGEKGKDVQQPKYLTIDNSVSPDARSLKFRAAEVGFLDIQAYKMLPG